MKEAKEEHVICWKGKRKDGVRVAGCGENLHEKREAEYLARSLEKETNVPHFVYLKGR